MGCLLRSELPVNGRMQSKNDHRSGISKKEFSIRCGRLRKEFKRNGLKFHPSLTSKYSLSWAWRHLKLETAPGRSDQIYFANIGSQPPLGGVAVQMLITEEPGTQDSRRWTFAEPVPWPI